MTTMNEDELKSWISALKEEPDEQFYLHVGRTKDYKFLTLNANSKTSSEVCMSRTVHSTKFLYKEIAGMIGA
jgi:protease II